MKGAEAKAARGRWRGRADRGKTKKENRQRGETREIKKTEKPFVASTPVSIVAVVVERLLL